MKTEKFKMAFVIFSLFASAFFYSSAVNGAVSSNNQVVPNGYANTPGTATFLGPLANAQRTYQFLIHANQLSALVGSPLTGIRIRLPVSATTNWPVSNVSFNNYDIYLSNSVDPANRSLTFANNIVGPQTQVKSGPMTIPANSYTFGSNPNAFGPIVQFDNPWFYNGGNLLIEIRHTGFTGTSRSTDAISTSTPGYGTNFSACWTGNYTGVTGSQGNFTIVEVVAKPLQPEPVLSFYQLDFNMNGLTESFSDWGIVEVSSNGYQSIKYFNLAVAGTGIDTVWQVQNGILFNQENYGDPQQLTFAFDIGNLGTPVSNVTIGYSITDVPLVNPPPITESKQVFSRFYEVHDGFPFFNPFSIGLKMPKAKPFQNSGTVKEPASHGVVGMPNQDCGIKECAPAGFSNSLKYLRKEHNLNFDSAFASLDSMKKATGFNDQTMTADNYYQKKDEYLKKNNIPITTRKLDKKNIYGLQKELDNEQDVEMFVWWFNIDTVSGDTSTGSHIVNVTNIKKLGGGKYQVTAQDDRSQGQAGGTTSETVTYDSATNTFTSGTYTAYNMGIYHFVVECPNKMAAQQLVPPNQSGGVNPGSPLKWTKEPGAASYWLEVATDPLFQFPVIDNNSVPDSFYIPAQNELLPGLLYFWRVRVNDSAGPGSYLSVFEFTTGLPKTLSLQALVEGMYNAQTDLMIPDTMRVQLRDMFPPYNVVDSAKSVLNLIGFGTFSFYSIAEGVPYYIVLNHRNAVLTYSSAGVTFFSGSAFYDFTPSAALAFGSNMIMVDLIPVKFAIYSGDVNKDGTVDATDLSSIDNDAFNFVSGYVVTDLTGDGFVDATDYSIADNNATNFVGAIVP